jgi:hypothetical protein
MTVEVAVAQLSEFNTVLNHVLELTETTNRCSNQQARFISTG